MVESEPKKLFVSLPVLYVSANTKSDQVRAAYVLYIGWASRVRHYSFGYRFSFFVRFLVCRT